jgi:hypothetical protein
MTIRKLLPLKLEKDWRRRLEKQLASHEWLMNLAALPATVASMTVDSSRRNM